MSFLSRKFISRIEDATRRRLLQRAAIQHPFSKAHTLERRDSVWTPLSNSWFVLARLPQGCAVAFTLVLRPDCRLYGSYLETAFEAVIEQTVAALGRLPETDPPPSAAAARELVHHPGVQLYWGRAHLTSLRARRRSPAV